MLAICSISYRFPRLLVQKIREMTGQVRTTATNAAIDSILANQDATQIKYLKEECLLVDESDHTIGTASKKDCHLLENINKGMLHRAFSVFLFNTNDQLLLQQRSHEKITYPLHFTNTCCSHPLNVDNERDGVEGVKVAARRKLEHELGIPQHEVPLDSMHFVTRIRYRSNNVPDDGCFGEHEIDYVLFAKRDVTVQPNENEVKSYKYVSRDELRRFINESEKNGTLITPWFRLIANHKLFEWWDNLDRIDRYADHDTIHKFG